MCTLCSVANATKQKTKFWYKRSTRQKEDMNMDNKMFCFQCEQTANCSGCTGNAGVCGKTADAAILQDEF